MQLRSSVRIPVRWDLWGAIVAGMFTHASAGSTLEDMQPLELQAAPQSPDEAWWTGPLLAASAATLPKGHLLVEPYVADAITTGRFDAHGRRDVAPDVNAYGSFTYVNYGLTDTLSTAVIPRFSFVDAAGPAGSSHIGLGDFSVQAQYRLSQYSEGRPIPTMSILATATLPTGRYDRLERRTGDTFGNGAFSTQVSIYAQYFSWLPTGRILRTRLNLSYSWSSAVDLEGVSTYGTPSGFRGGARPGRSAMIDAAGEYSATKSWVAAFDIVDEYTGVTKVQGEIYGAAQPTVYRVSSKSGHSIALAPALEYNWNAKVGVIAGVRWAASGRNTPVTVTPVAALNLFF